MQKKKAYILPHRIVTMQRKEREKKKEEGSPRKGWVSPEGSGPRPDTSRLSTETHGWVSPAVGWFFFFFFPSSSGE
jgi:hypothetical protein